MRIDASVSDADTSTVRLLLSQRLRDDVTLRVANDTVPLRVSTMLGVGAVAVAVGVGVGGGVTVSVTLVDSENDGVIVGGGVMVNVSDGVGGGVTVGERDAERLKVGD